MSRPRALLFIACLGLGCDAFDDPVEPDLSWEGEESFCKWGDSKLQQLVLRARKQQSLVRSLTIRASDNIEFLNGLECETSLEELKIERSPDSPALELSPLVGVTQLRSLHLTGGTYYGWYALAQLSLTTLSLQEVTELDESSLAGLNSLQELRLVGLKSPLSFLSSMLGLKQLSIHQVSIEDLPSLGALSSLQSLQLSDVPLLSLSGLEGSSGLSQLSVERSQLQDLSSLKQLVLWGKLSITETPSLMSLEGIEKQVHLKSLDVSGSAVSDLSPLSKLTLLRELNVSETQVQTLEPLRDLSLVSLSASGNQIEDLSPLVGMPLGILDVSFNQITEIPEGFVGSTGDCLAHNLTKNPLSEQAHESLRSLCSEGYFLSWDDGFCYGTCLVP